MLYTVFAFEKFTLANQPWLTVARECFTILAFHKQLKSTMTTGAFLSHMQVHYTT